MKLVALNILIPKELASRLSALRKASGTNVSAFVRLAIEARLNRVVVEAEPVNRPTNKFGGLRLALLPAFETLEQVNARRAIEGLPPLVPYVPPTPKPRRRSTRSSR